MSKEGAHQRFSFEDLFRQEKTECNRSNDLLGYFENQLPESQKHEFEEHLGNCSICVRNLVALQETEADGRDTLLDHSRAAAIFEQNRVKIERYLDRKYGRKSFEKAATGNVFSRFFDAFSLPGYANAAVIALVIVLLYPSYKSLVVEREVNRLQNELAVEKSRQTAAMQTAEQMKGNYEKQIQDLQKERGQLREPTLSPSMVLPARTERSTQSKSIQVAFNEKQPNFSIVFPVPETDFESYLVEVYQNENRIWQQEVKAASFTKASSLISVNLNAGYLKDGKYILKLSGTSSEGISVLAEYKLDVTGASN